jgi:hypothetical protein
MLPSTTGGSPGRHSSHQSELGPDAWSPPSKARSQVTLDNVRASVYTHRTPEAEAMRAVLTVTLMALALSVFPSPVRAADTGTCAESSAVNRFKGFGKVLASAAGAEAKLENQALNICTSATDNNRANHVFVAVDGNDSLANDLVQAGVMHCVNNSNPDCTNYGTHEFWAWGRSHLAAGCAGFSDVPPIQHAIAGFPGGTWAYTVLKTSSQWQVKVNGTVQETLSLGSICWTPKRALYTGESWDIRDAIGGPVDNPFHVSSAIYETSVGGVWSNVNWGTGSVCNLAPTDARYKCNAPTGTSMDLWTVQP